MIKAVLVDDEVHCLETLTILLHDHCPEVEVIEKFRTAPKALEWLNNNRPDILFLDIEMPGMNGFQLLESLSDISFAIIFTTSYDQYALRAIRFSALDYLLKPIDHTELAQAVARASQQQNRPIAEQFRMLLEQVHGPSTKLKKVAVPTLEGFEMILAEDVLKCEASDNYTTLFLKSGQKIVACRTLKQVEEQLAPFQIFLRVHNSFVVNLNEITRYVRGEGGYLTMSDGSVVNVSRSRKQALLKFM